MANDPKFRTWMQTAARLAMERFQIAITFGDEWTFNNWNMLYDEKLSPEEGLAREFGPVDEAPIWYFIELNPTTAAEHLADIHLRRTVVDGTRVLAQAYHDDKAKQEPPKRNDDKLYMRSSVSSDHVDWALERRDHWIWLKTHTWGAVGEYDRRFGASHPLRAALLTMERSPDWLARGSLEDPPLVMPEELQSRPKGAVWNFQNWYKTLEPELTWTNRAKPEWLVEAPDIDGLAENLIRACELGLVEPDQWVPENLDPAVWDNVKHLAVEKINGRSK